MTKNTNQPADAPGPSISVTLDVEAADAPDAERLRKHLAAVADQLRLTDVELSVVVVGDAMMAKLHEQYSGIPGPTDVLTFDLRDDPFSPPLPWGEGRGEGALDHGAPPIDGEIYICLDEARRRAAGRGHDLEREVLLYAVHGLLHLLGYDDHDPDDHARMHAREDELLQAIGVGRVYGEDA